VDELSSRDHPDWWKNVGGQNSQDSILERRSLVWNDNNIEDGTVPGAFYDAETYKGKFFTRGCRGMLEQLQLYCIGDGADTITLRYSPHPCLGPFGEVVITPAAAWAWQAFMIEEMWNYDSLFIWVYVCEANVDWAYDAEPPFDGHESGDAGAMWSDMAIRPFIRAVYTGETPGDVPVSGIINNIKIPNSSSGEQSAPGYTGLDVWTPLVTVHGAGYCDLLTLDAWPIANSHVTSIEVECDGVRAGRWQLSGLSGDGFNDDTQPLSLLLYAANGKCFLQISKLWEFRRLFRLLVYNGMANVPVTVHAYPTLLR